MDEPPTKDWRTDAQLFDAINRTDASAFDEFYRRYRDYVFRLAHRFTANQDDALDVLQETFAYLLKKSPELVLSAKATTYLYPIVRSLSLTVLRKKRSPDTSRSSIEELSAPPSHSLGLNPDLHAVLAGLSEPQREVLLMRVLDDMTQEEIAQTLGIPVGTVKSRLHHALMRLRTDPRTRKYFEVD